MLKYINVYFFISIYYFFYHLLFQKKT